MSDPRWHGGWKGVRNLSPMSEEQMRALGLDCQIIDDPGGKLTFDELEAMAAKMKAHQPWLPVVYRGPSMCRERRPAELNDTDRG